MRRFFPRKRRTADLIPQMKALGIDRVIDKVSDSLSALEQAKEEAWKAQASSWSSAVAQPAKWDNAIVWDECKRRHLDPLFEHCERNGCSLCLTPECEQMRRTIASEISTTRFGVVSDAVRSPMSAPIPSVYPTRNPNPIEVLIQQGVLTQQEARVRAQGVDRRSSFLQTESVTVPEPVTTEEGRMKGLINSWQRNQKKKGEQDEH